MDTTATTMTADQLSLFELLVKGGVVIYPLLILSVISVYIIIERFVAIRRAAKTDLSLVSQIKTLLQSDNVEAAKMLTVTASSATGNILNSGLLMLGRPAKEVEAIMESSAGVEIAEMEKGLGYLGLIAGVAPMLGFVGTIAGVIKIFYSISLADNISVGNISGGLYEKMVSSGTGLIVGMLAYAGYHMLNMMIDRYGLRMQKQVFEFLLIIQTGNESKTK